MVADKIQRVEQVSGKSDVLPNEYPEIVIGQWYWVKLPKPHEEETLIIVDEDDIEDDDEEESEVEDDSSPRVKEEPSDTFECVIHVGSNYIEMSDIYESSHRIHIDDFYGRCRPESDPETVIAKNTKEYQAKVNDLMARVVDVTARLGVGASPELTSGAETMALATVEAGRDFKTYKTDLVRAKEELLPELFKEIEVSNKELVRWMKARVVPFRAQVGQMKSVIGRIDDRIFNVELYAGLTEEVELITDGEPASLGEKIRILQRRCYMDEECLVGYETGGMEFKDLHDFDSWLARPKNRDRILPFQRCIVSFRVRRNMKERCFFGSFIDMMELAEKIKADEITFLYIRNGEKLYRMNCDLDFGHKLFPDMDQQSLTGKLWAKGAPHVSSIITDDRYQGLIEDFEKEKLEEKKKAKEHKIKHKAWKAAKKAAEVAGTEFDEREPWYHPSYTWDPRDSYEEFDKNNIYYDDIREKINSDIQHHNRIGLILQGLLDRSMVLHPHPPWKIWTTEGFRTALELIYDEDRALVAGEKPDFEAYRAKLNESLRKGSVTIGQDPAWVKSEQKKMNDREREMHRYSGWRPHGNPGPGKLARVASFDARTQVCSYAWMRDGSSWKTSDQKFRCRFRCKAKVVLNVDAYKPGDFHQFFDDPRTREEYLKWAPLMLEAEEYHAGNREIADPPPPQPAKPSSFEGQRRYHHKRLKKLYMRKAVKLTDEITTTGGKTYKPGSLWRIVDGTAGTFTIRGILKDGTYDPDGRSVSRVHSSDFTLEDSIPDPNAPTRRRREREDEEDDDED